MEIIKCSMNNLDAVSDFYGIVVDNLEKTTNYPKWSKKYPCRESVKTAIESGTQYACIENGNVIGAFILNDNPGGNYSVGEWKKELNEGEYSIIHTLAVDFRKEHKGIGKFMVDYCIEKSRKDGYKAVRLDVVPDNFSAIRLYEGRGFTFAGTKDLERGIEDIPLFNLYELNF